jgi:hypothetical protein
LVWEPFFHGGGYGVSGGLGSDGSGRIGSCSEDYVGCGFVGSGSVKEGMFGFLAVDVDGAISGGADGGKMGRDPRGAQFSMRVT